MRSLREQLTTNGLARIAANIEAVAKPSILLYAGEICDASSTRLGGRPNLPDDVPWPRWNGTSLPFVAQLDLATISPDHGLSLPNTGALYFFYEGGQKAWGGNPSDRGSAQVIYSSAPLSTNPLRPLPGDIPRHFQFTGVCLDNGRPDISIPDDSDQILDGLFRDPDERNHYWEFHAQRNEAEGSKVFHRIGGYPDPVQADTRLSAQLITNGLYGKDAFKQGKAMGLWPGAVEWELMLQVDSEESAGMMWGDAGRIYFLIRKQDLAVHAFDRIWLILECC